MAHSLDFSRGKAAFFSYRQPAWHGLGEVPTTPITSIADALALGQLDYRVEIAPRGWHRSHKPSTRPLQCGQ